MPKKIKSAENVTARIGEEFSKELEEIKEKRIERNIDKKRKSTRVLTNLIVKHEDWKRIKRDSINFNFKKNEK